MNPELQQLKDIHLPPAIPMWPMAPGWIILLGLLLGAIGWLMYILYERHQNKKPIKYALAQLKKLAAANANENNVATEISILIRRTALCYFPREEIASLTGDQWLQFLDNSGNTQQFTQGIGRLLIDAPYQQTNSTNLTPVFSLTQDWLITVAKNNKLTRRK